jgi:hypothetical protein
MSPNEFLQLWAQLKIALIKNRAREVLLTSSESLALIRLRVQNTGEDADNITLGFYSAQYERKRERENLPTDFVNLTATGGMWRETGVFLEEETETSSTAVVTGRTQRAANLLTFNSDRYGDLLRLSGEEERQITQAYIQRKIAFIQNFLQ